MGILKLDINSEKSQTRLKIVESTYQETRGYFLFEWHILKHYLYFLLCQLEIYFLET